MNFFFPIVIAAFLFEGTGCSEPAANTGNIPHLPGDTCITMSLRESEMGTDWAINPVQPPAPFYLDSAITDDSLDNRHEAKYFIGSIENTELAVLCQLSLPGAGFFPGETSDYHTDEAWVNSFYKTGNLVSMLLVEQSYTQGAAHYNRDANCLNYDLKRKKAVRLGDIIDLSSKEKQQAFCELLNIAQNEGQPAENFIQLDSSYLNAGTDFTIGCGMLTVYPGEIRSMNIYETTGLEISLLKVKSLLRPEYKWLLQE